MLMLKEQKKNNIKVIINSLIENEPSTWKENSSHHCINDAQEKNKDMMMIIIMKEYRNIYMLCVKSFVLIRELWCKMTRDIKLLQVE